MDKRGRTWKEVVAASLLINAVRGSAQAIHEILERIDGKVAHQVDLDVDVLSRVRLMTDAELEAIVYGGAPGEAGGGSNDGDK